VPSAASRKSGSRVGCIVRRAAAAGVILVLGASLAGCSGPTPGPAAAATQKETPTPTPTTTPEPEPTLNPQTSAAANLAYFDFLSRKVVAAHPVAGGQRVDEQPPAGGFDKARMQVTFDRTKADLAADSIMFSVRFNGECLIGQNGPATRGYHSMVAHPLGSGTCLVGRTRQIDW
jgi:hypothetical protein